MIAIAPKNGPDQPLWLMDYYGDRSFAYAAAMEWNKLPLEIRQLPSVDSFKKHLKTHLFQQYFK